MSLDHNKSRGIIRQFATQLAHHVNRDEDAWWVTRLLQGAWCEDLSLLSHTDFGFLISLDTGSPAGIRIAIQPGPGCTPQTFAEILALAGENGKQAADTLNQLGPGRGVFRGEWYIAVGAAVDAASEDLRVYVGLQDPTRTGRIYQTLHEIGFWCPRFTNAAVEVIDRIRLCGTLTGFSKRCGTKTGYKLYFVNRMPLSNDLIAYVGESLGVRAITSFQTFAEHCAQGSAIESPHHGWGVVLDAMGELAYVELEIARSHVSLPLSGLIPDDSTFKNELSWVFNTGQICGLTVEAHTVSCKARIGASSVTFYFDFSSNGCRGQPQGGCEKSFSLPLVGYPNRSESSSRSTDEACLEAPIAARGKRGAALFEAVQRALAAVLAMQCDNGKWTDFYIPDVGGVSDTWVTAHVGLRLANLPSTWSNPAIVRALEAATDYLLSTWRSGWGYNEQSPVDADSTAHALLFLQAIGREIPRHAVHVLLRFQQNDGGFATFRGTAEVSAAHSWYISHPDVTPIVIRALVPYITAPKIARVVTQACQHIEIDRIDDHTWPAFWWRLRWYTASAWLQAFRAINAPLPAFGRLLGQDGTFQCTSDLDSALLHEFLTAMGSVNDAQPIVQYLVRRQCEDGLWPSVPVLRVAKPEVYRPWEAQDAGTLYADVQGVYSAATILSTLAQFTTPGDGP